MQIEVFFCNTENYSLLGYMYDKYFLKYRQKRMGKLISKSARLNKNV